MARPRIVAAIMLLAGGLAGCSGVPVISNAESPTALDFSDLFSETYHRELPLEVRNGIFGQTAQMVSPTIASQVPSSAIGLDTRVVPLTGQARTYRLVMDLSPITVGRPADLCAYGVVPSTNVGTVGSEGAAVFGALCRGTSPISAATGSVGGVRSVDDPAFRSMVAQLAMVLMPRAGYSDHADGTINR